MGDRYDEQLSAARYRAERDQARQELARLRGEATTMSAYDLLPEEDRDAIAWMRDHGGLEKIIRQRRDSVPRDAYERKRGKLLKHIAECEKALGKRKKRVEELEAESEGLRKRIKAMLPRLMPEGMEWPRYDTGEPLKLDDEVAVKNCEPVTVRFISFDKNGFSVRHTSGCRVHWFTYGERVKRPAPKVLDADGAEIRVGDTVYQMGCKYRVSHLHGANDYVRIVYENSGRWVNPKTLTHRAPVLAADGKPLEVGQTVYVARYEYQKCTVLSFEWMHDDWLVEVKNEGGHKFRLTPDEFTHQHPVLAADGRPLREGETVWDTKGNGPYIIKKIENDGVVRIDGSDLGYFGSEFVHERPDTWERIEEDAYKDDCEYFGRDLNGCEGCPASRQDIDNFYCDENEKASDLVRRAKALAGVS